MLLVNRPWVRPCLGVGGTWSVPNNGFFFPNDKIVSLKSNCICFLGDICNTRIYNIHKNHLKAQKWNYATYTYENTGLCGRLYYYDVTYQSNLWFFPALRQINSQKLALNKEEFRVFFSPFSSIFKNPTDIFRIFPANISANFARSHRKID